ncbi:MAG: F0F1 ATP synthase subunit A [Chloroflexi bacterium]|nr:F0F1 ATP synthase subunit A [Chloroflexota bacterium]
METYPSAAQGAMDGIATAAVRIPPDVVFHLFGVLPVTNTMFSTWTTMALLIAVVGLATRRLSMTPSTLQNAWEMFCETWIAIVDRTIGPRARRYVPLLGGSFLFILVANWLGTLPLKHLKIMAPDGREAPLFRPATSDINLTIAMAIFVIMLVEAAEIRAVGLRGYLRSLAIPNPFRLLELVARPLSLALRLFGNIFAGDVLVGMILGVAPVVLFLVLGLELFVGLVQAVIFSALLLVFLSVAVAHERPEAPSTVTGGHGQPRSNSPAAVA